MARWKYQFRVNLQYFPLEKPKRRVILNTEKNLAANEFIAVHFIVT